MRRGIASSSFASHIWTPSKYGDLLAWYDASDASTIIEDGGVVSEWRDKSGNGLHVSQPIISARPTKGVTVWNKPTIKFNGDHFLSVSGLNYPRPLTAIVVFTPQSPSSAALTLRSGNGLYMSRSDTTSRFNAWLSGGQEISLSIPVVQNIPAITTTIAAISPTRSEFRLNGGQKVGSGLFNNTSTATDVIIGDVNTTQGSGLIGDVSEILIFNRVLSEAEYSEVEEKLRIKYQTTLASNWFTGQRLWLSAGNLQLSAGAAVESWNNAANKWTFVQTDPLKQPVFALDNGFPALRFKSGDRLINGGQQRGYSRTMLFAVVAKVSTLDEMPLLGLNNGVNAMFWVKDRKPWLRVYGGSWEFILGDEQALDNTWAVYSARYNADGLLEARLNLGTKYSTPAITTINSSDRETIIGGHQTDNFVGDIAEIAHYTQPISDYHWDEIVDTLMAKYAIV